MPINELSLGGDFPSFKLPPVATGLPPGSSFAGTLKEIITETDKSQQTAPINRTSGSSFADTLRDMVSDVNDLQIESGEKTDAFLRGDEVDLHDVMIASNKAKTSFQLLLELRNKGLDLYREISRLQV